MKLEIFKDGKLYMTIEAVGGETEDFVAIPKKLVRHSMLSASSFEDLFMKYAKTSPTYVDAYEKAEEVHLQYFDRRRYANYNSFRLCMKCL